MCKAQLREGDRIRALMSEGGGNSQVNPEGTNRESETRVRLAVQGRDGEVGAIAMLKSRKRKEEENRETSSIGGGAESGQAQPTASACKHPGKADSARLKG